MSNNQQTSKNPKQTRKIHKRFYFQFSVVSLQDLHKKFGIDERENNVVSGVCSIQKKNNNTKNRKNRKMSEEFNDGTTFIQHNRTTPNLYENFQVSFLSFQFLVCLIFSSHFLPFHSFFELTTLIRIIYSRVTRATLRISQHCQS